MFFNQLPNSKVFGINHRVTVRNNHVVTARAVVAERTAECCTSIGGYSCDLRAITKDLDSATIVIGRELHRQYR